MTAWLVCYATGMPATDDNHFVMVFTEYDKAMEFAVTVDGYVRMVKVVT